MSTAIEVYEAQATELRYLQALGGVLADSRMFDDALTAERAVAKVLAGREFGMGPLEAMRSFHVIDGKVELSADTQARLVKESSRYDYRVLALNDDLCEIHFFEDGEPCGISRFTLDDADKAGLIKSGGAWEKWPRNMLFARALTNGVSWFAPDAVGGGRDRSEIVQVSTDVEPVPITGPNSGDGKAEVDGSETEVASDPNRGESEGPRDDAIATATRTREEGPEDSPEPSDPPAPPAGTESDEAVGTDSPDHEVPPRGSTAEASSLAGGSADVRALSSQVNQLMRHAVAMRWDEEAITRELGKSYPGVVNMANLTQEQARELIPIWGRYVRDTRMTREQQDRLKPLCTVTDAKKAAEALFGFKVSNLGELTADEGDRLLEKIATVRAEQAQVSA